MLAQDPLGYVHEVPELGYAGYGLAEFPDGSIGEMPFDGYGGYEGYGGYAGYGGYGLPFLAPLAAALAPMAAQAVGRILPSAAQAVGRIIPGVMNAAGAAGRILGQGVSALRQGFQQGGAMPMPMMPGMPAMPGAPGMPAPMPRPFFPRPIFRAPQPVGWVTPALPFTGTRPRRLYMRCSVWPGPAGMVPAFANQALPAPGMPGVMPPPGGRRRRRRGRR
jgi:hypothetical protein